MALAPGIQKNKVIMRNSFFMAQAQLMNIYNRC